MPTLDPAQDKLTGRELVSAGITWRDVFVDIPVKVRVSEREGDARRERRCRPSQHMRMALFVRGAWTVYQCRREDAGSVGLCSAFPPMHLRQRMRMALAMEFCSMDSVVAWTEYECMREDAVMDPMR